MTKWQAIKLQKKPQTLLQGLKTDHSSPLKTKVLSAVDHTDQLKRLLGYTYLHILYITYVQ